MPRWPTRPRACGISKIFRQALFLFTDARSTSGNCLLPDGINYLARERQALGVKHISMGNAVFDCMTRVLTSTVEKVVAQGKF